MSSPPNDGSATFRVSDEHRYRDTAIVFTFTSPSLFIKFRIRLSNTADRYSLCVALSEFIPVHESLPAQKGVNSRAYMDTTSLSQNMNTSRCNSQNCVSGCTDTCNTSSTPLSTCKSEYHVSSPSDFHSFSSQRRLSQEIFASSQQYSNSSSSPYHSHSPFSPLSSQRAFSPLQPPPKVQAGTLKSYSSSVVSIFWTIACRFSCVPKPLD
ncbi:hypothetical protein Y032_0501g2612 [Ancylostoma ceylanicum]|uniref:Uncharacterized protein n=1 Tax=Ancylostoma ceylanicum TaxID=53326 RepID=A0A016WVA5_9BILA|nr:hypothetical protein Y032_0501g2612 [Ancylostoma ceylanicum]